MMAILRNLRYPLALALACSLSASCESSPRPINTQLAPVNPSSAQPANQPEAAQPKPAPEQPKPAADAQPEKPRLGFIYGMCNDLSAVRALYRDAIGLEELSFRQASADATGWAVYQAAPGISLMFFTWDSELELPSDFAWQPGDGQGEAARSSFSIEIPHRVYAATIKRVLALTLTRASDAPSWRQDSYWGLTINDPAGNTIELYSTPPTRPASTVWPN